MLTADGREVDLLPVNTRIRHVRVRELTGRIKANERNRPGVLSAIPYCIGWDDPGLAHERLGFLFVYADVDTVEQLPCAECGYHRGSHAEDCDR